MSVPQEYLDSLERFVVEGADLFQAALPEEEAMLDRAVLERFAGIVERCAIAADQAGFAGLQDACSYLSQSVTSLEHKDDRDPIGERHLLGEWSELVLNYLSASGPDSLDEAASALLRHLQDGYWEHPLPDEDAEVLRELLTQWQAGFAGEGPQPAEAPAAESAADRRDETSPDVRDTESDPVEAISVDPDMLRLLQGEMGSLTESLMALCADEDAGEGDNTALQDGLERTVAVVERLAMAAQAIGFPPLHRTYAAVQDNLRRFVSAQNSATDSLEILLDWAALATDYLENPGEPDRARALAEILADSRWSVPLAQQEADAVAAGLSAIAIESGPSEERETEARPEDVSLAVPDDINPELLEGLLQELPAQTTEFSETVEKLTLSGQSADIDTARRIAHTLKGAANVVGVRGVANLTHQLEDILNALATFGGTPPAPLASTLVEAADCLAEMNDSLLGLGPQPAQAQEVLQRVLDWANRIDREGIDADAVEAPPASAQTMANRMVVVPTEADQVPSPPEPVASTEPANAQVTPMLRVPAALLDNLLRLAGESVILNGRLQESVLGGIRQAQSVRTQNLALQHLIQELEHLVDVQGVSLPGFGNAEQSDATDFDPLEFEQYNELYTVVRKLQEVATDSRELSHDIDGRLAQLKGLLGDQLRLNHEHQEAALLTRMVPVKTVEQRLYRGVRQASRLSDKSVSVLIEGTDTLVESNVLHDLIEPLMHILRNAVDHGIEDADTREAQGKPATGRIELGFVREGSYVLVRCQDDGAGLDYTTIQRKATERGLLKPGYSASEEDLNRILMSPGFSTREGVTQVSGRGIGMDVVKTAVARLKGSVYIHSEAGRGCRVDLRLPVTLLSTQALLIRLRKQVFAVSERGVQQVLHSDAGKLGRIGDKPTFETEDRVYGVKALDDTLGLPSDRRDEQRDSRPVILVELGSEGTVAVLVDEVVDSRELVVKPMGPYVPHIPGIPGATILGDGGIVPVLDLPELMSTPVSIASDTTAEEAFAGAEVVTKTALVVDDSLSARRSMAQFVKDAGFDVRTAIDGLEAVGIIDADKPDILLVDMEMPRMNGIELTAHLRANAETRDLPVIMITSRSTDKHRLQAGNAGVNAYMTKPFVEEELLGKIHELLGAA